MAIHLDRGCKSLESPVNVDKEGKYMNYSTAKGKREWNFVTFQVEVTKYLFII